MHSRLGPIQKVDTKGLDYTLILANGRALMVNAEEEPGKLYEHLDGRWQPAPFQPDDWTLKVELVELGPLRPAREL